MRILIGSAILCLVASISPEATDAPRLSNENQSLLKVSLSNSYSPWVGYEIVVTPKERRVSKFREMGDPSQSEFVFDFSEPEFERIVANLLSIGFKEVTTRSYTKCELVSLHSSIYTVQLIQADQTYSFAWDTGCNGLNAETTLQDIKDELDGLLKGVSS